MNFHYGKFVWFEHISQDVEKARAFYEILFGWQAPGEMVGNRHYHMIVNSTGGIGGFRNTSQVTPSHWFSYLSVADVDLAAAAISKTGGTIVMPPTDFPTLGRGCIFSDPQGAVLSVWHSSQGDRPDNTNAVTNHWYWNELMSTNAAAATGFYCRIFGFNVTEVPMDNMGTYYLLSKDGVPRAGVIQSPQAEMGSFWMPYVLVDNCDTFAAKAQALGAVIFMLPLDVPKLGRVVIMQDPSGAFLGFIQVA